MSFLYQGGEGLNLLARAHAVTGLTCSPAADANFPVANVCNGRPSVYFKPGSSGASSYIQADLNLVKGGDGQYGDLTAWTLTQDTGAPTLTEYATSPYTGANSLRILVTGLASAAHWAQATQTIRLRAGEKARLYSAGKVTTGTNVQVIVTNLETGDTLKSDGTWAASQVAATYSTGSWVDGYITFTMPDAESIGGFWARVTVAIKANVTSGTGYDVGAEVKVVPGWDTLVVLGHQATPITNRLGLEYQALSTNNPLDAWSSGTAVATWLKTPATNTAVFPDAELHQPAIWNQSTAVRYERWVRIYVTGATPPPGYGAVGEVILCQSETPTRAPRAQIDTMYAAAGQLRYQSRTGDEWVYNGSPHLRRKLILTFDSCDGGQASPDDSVERAIRRLFAERTQAGRWPLVVIPHTMDPRMVVYGHVRSEMLVSYDAPRRTYEVEVEEAPIPGLSHTMSST